MYLGFDLSTQSCKCLVMHAHLAVLGESRVHFDSDLPRYKTADGVHRHAGGRVTTPVRLWIEAIELAVERLRAQGCPFDRVVAISGSGQQHGSVYWSKAGVEALAKMDGSSGSSLVKQLEGAFALDDSPIWMDTSTTESCKELTKRLGGPLEVAKRTGSLATERFSGHFFRRFVAEKGFDNLGGLSLVSSLGASLLVGKVVPIDISDAAGTNLMDIQAKRWDPDLLDFVAPGKVNELRAVLAEPVDSWTKCGKVHPYWIHKYGFSPDCNVVVWSGDNPCAVVGNGLVAEGDLTISLGTSDTALAVIPRLPKEPQPFGHLFPHPILKDCYWSMLCYANGDVTRRRVRDSVLSATDASWDEFSKLLKEAPAGNDGNVGMFFTNDEITPPVNTGADVRGSMAAGPEAKLQRVASFPDAKTEARAVIEMRALAVKTHLDRLMPDQASAGRSQLLLTGGASNNKDILQVFADAFQRTVCCMDVSEGAAFGAAVRALHATNPSACRDLRNKLQGLRAVRAQPSKDPRVIEAYRRAAKAYAQLEAEVVSERGRL